MWFRNEAKAVWTSIGRPRRLGHEGSGLLSPHAFDRFGASSISRRRVILGQLQSRRVARSTSASGHHVREPERPAQVESSRAIAALGMAQPMQSLDLNAGSRLLILITQGVVEG